MNRLRWWMALLAIAMLPQRTSAVIGTIDVVPAATLLLPYFEVHPEPTRTTTLLSINNASAESVIAHVTLWTDLGVPTFAFDVFLTGYDIQTLDLRDVLFGGTLPSTFACLPVRPLSAARRNHLQAAHSGKAAPGFGGMCAGHDHGDNVLRGYVTVDSATTCSSANLGSCSGEAECTTACGAYCASAGGTLDSGHCSGFCQSGSNDGGDCSADQDCPGGSCIAGDPPSCQCRCQVFPTGTGYFINGGGGIAADTNALWGDSIRLDPANSVAIGQPVVHIEASSTDARLTTVGNYTFYGHLVNGTAADNREPLPTTWGTSYVNSLTELICWRDTGTKRAPFVCGAEPQALPTTEIVVFDNAETPLSGGEQPTTCGLASSRVVVGGPALPTPFKTGWIYLNLNHSASPLFDGVEQSYIAAVRSIAPGRATISADAVAFDSGIAPSGASLAARIRRPIGGTTGASGEAAK